MMGSGLSPEPFTSWDDLRFFLATSESGSFSKAASHLGVTQPTISRRIENLENRLGVRLFDRLPNGVVLTSEGQRMLETARHIEEMVLEIQRNLYGSDKRFEGRVRISVTDGLAAYWLTPRLAEFQQQHPRISIEFMCSIEPADPLRMETDLSIRFRWPTESDLIAVRLATFHFVPWASQGYLDQHGTPQSAEELLGHRLLDHFAYYDDDGDWTEWFGIARAANLISFRTNSSASLLSAIQNGLGIGLLPTYARDCVSGIVPLDLGLRTHSDVWLVYHPALRGAARMGAVIDWVRDQFQPDDWPWFREEFVQPSPVVGHA